MCFHCSHRTIYNVFFCSLSRKMLPSSKKSSGWQKLRHGNDKENIPIDSNTSSYFPLSPSSSSSGESSDFWQPPLESQPFRDINNNTYAIPKTYLNSCSDGSEPGSSGYGSAVWMSPQAAAAFDDFMIHKDEFSSSFESLLKPLQSFRLKDDTLSFVESPPSFPYSPLSSFNFADAEFLAELHSDRDLISESPF